MRDAEASTDADSDSHTVYDGDTDEEGGADADEDVGSDEDADADEDAESDEDADVDRDIPPIETVIFTESFEHPDITGIANPDDPTGWVTTAHPSYVTLGDEDSGLFTTPYGEQASRVYGIATATTSAAILNEVLAANTIYVITFNVCQRNDEVSYGPTGYIVDFLAIDESGDEVTETLLASVTGTSVDTDDMSQSDSLVFETGTTHPNLGERIAIRLRKEPSIPWQTNPQFDNLRITTYR